MNNFLLFLIFLFLILFTIDKKPINIPLDFIGVILSSAIYILYNNNIDISIFSYLLMIIYGSAIVILFGFIIMLYHYTKSFIPSSVIKEFLNKKPKETLITLFSNKNYNVKLINIIIISSIVILINYYIYTNLDNIKELINMLLLEENINIINITKEERKNIMRMIFDWIYNSDQTPIIISVIINLLLLVMVGIIYILT